VQDHLLVGSPGTPSQDAALCEHCGRVLEHIVQTIGSELNVQVQHAQQDATEQDTPAIGRKKAQAANRPSARPRRRPHSAQDESRD
jgi:hypothetical protein